MDKGTKFVDKVATTVKEFTEKVGNAANDIMVPLKEILETAGRKDVNAQVIMESFDLSQEDLIGFDESYNHINLYHYLLL